MHHIKIHEVSIVTEDCPAHETTSIKKWVAKNVSPKRIFSWIFFRKEQYGVTSIFKKMNIHYYGYTAFSNTDKETLKIFLYMLKMLYWTS